MRLIDADAMNEELFYKQLGGKDALITAESAFNMIKAQPTAYDIEKVVTELEVREKTSKECYVEAMTDGIFSSASRFCGEKYAYNRAIDIVKAGGENE